MSKPATNANRINVQVWPRGSESIFLVKQQRLVPAEIDARCEDPAVAFDLEFRIAFDEEGLPVCTSLLVEQRPGGSAITKTALAGVPLRELVATAVGSASTPAKMSNSGKRVHFEVDGMDGTPMPVKDVYRAFRRTRPRAPASNRITDEYLQDVAEVYRQALDRGDPPTQTVADVFVLPRPTAARHVGMARKKEFLGSTTPGRKGEAK